MNTNQEQFLIAIARITKFSPAPMILAKAMKLLRDPKSDLSSIAELVGRDPSLAADIIRCANSAYYGSGQPIQTIGDAVQKIGFRETIHLLNVAVSRVTSERDLGSYGISADDFWAESLFNGVFLRNLAAMSGRADADEAYTIGLLRFIGRLAINQAIDDLCCGVFWQGKETISEWEMENVGFVQAQAGAILLANWQFSDEMVQAIAGQDAPNKLPRRNWLAEALHFASVLFAQGIGMPLQFALAEACTSMPMSRDFAREAGLTAEHVEILLARTRDDCDAIRKNFGA